MREFKWNRQKQKVLNIIKKILGFKDEINKLNE